MRLDGGRRAPAKLFPPKTRLEGPARLDRESSIRPSEALAGSPADGASAALDRLGAARGRHREGALRFPWSGRDGLLEDLSGRARAAPALAPEAGRVRPAGVRVRGRVRAGPGGDEPVLLSGHRS